MKVYIILKHVDESAIFNDTTEVLGCYTNETTAKTEYNNEKKELKQYSGYWIELVDTELIES